MSTAKFKVGDIVRYGKGDLALYKIQSIDLSGTKGPKYTGLTAYNANRSEFESYLTAATKADLITWNKTLNGK